MSRDGSHVVYQQRWTINSSENVDGLFHIAVSMCVFGLLNFLFNVKYYKFKE